MQCLVALNMRLWQLLGRKSTKLRGGDMHHNASPHIAARSNTCCTCLRFGWAVAPSSWIAKLARQETMATLVLAHLAGSLAELDESLRAHEEVFQGAGVGVEGKAKGLQAAVLSQQLQPIPAAIGILSRGRRFVECPRYTQQALMLDPSLHRL